MPAKHRSASSALISAVLPLRLSWPVNIGMHHPHMSGQCVIARESLLFRTQMTSHLLFPCIVDGVFVSGKIVRPRKDGIAWLARTGVDALAFVWTSL